MTEPVMKAGESRVWHFPDGVGPGKTKQFLGWARIGDPTYNFGDVEPIEVPDPLNYNQFIKVDEIQGAEENPTASVMARYPRLDVSEMLKAGRKRCPVHIQAHIGKCDNPQDFNGGWDKILFFPQSRYTSWSGENLGALASDDQSPANETGEISARDLYEGKKLQFAEVCDTEAAREIVSVNVCDAQDCGECGAPSDGCSKVFAVMVGVDATPGTIPSVIFSEDGGTTCSATNIDTLFSNETPNDSDCVGPDFVVVSSIGGMHIADKEAILAGTESWIEPTTGFVIGNGPTAIWSVDVLHTWLAAENGYIYFASSIRGGVSVQDAGVATTQDLVDIHALDSLHVVAVGALNAVVYTENGGETWLPITGPSAGVQLNAVWMLSEGTWLIGDNAGDLWFTEDSGDNWTEITDIPMSLENIDDIQFVDEVVGYMAARAGANDGRIFRTIDGGATWYELPEGTTGQLPAADRINSLAVCSDVNYVWGGGLDDDGSAGLLVKAA